MPWVPPLRLPAGTPPPHSQPLRGRGVTCQLGFYRRGLAQVTSQCHLAGGRLCLEPHTHGTGPGRPAPPRSGVRQRLAWLGLPLGSEPRLLQAQPG